MSISVPIPRIKRSPIWKHFEYLESADDSCNAKCIHCTQILSTKAGSIGNLWRHYRKIHPLVNALEAMEKNINEDSEEDVINEGEVTNVWLEDQANESNSQSDYKTEQQSTEEVQYEIKSIKPRCIEIKPKRKKEFHSQEFVQHNTQIDEREFEAIGANVACKLKRMTPDQRCLAELLINKVLMCGLKDNLTDDTDLTEVYKT